MRHVVVMVTTSYPRFPGDSVGTFMEPIAKGVAARALATATYHGAAATVYVALQDSRALVYVLANRDCHLLTAQFIGTR